MSKSTEELANKLYTLLNQVAETAYCNGADMEYPSDLLKTTPVEGEKAILQLFDQELERRVEEAIILFQKDMNGWNYQAYLDENPDDIALIVADCGEKSARYVRKTLNNQTKEE